MTDDVRERVERYVANHPNADRWEVLPALGLGPDHQDLVDEILENHEDNPDDGPTPSRFEVPVDEQCCKPRCHEPRVNPHPHSLCNKHHPGDPTRNEQTSIDDIDDQAEQHDRLLEARAVAGDEPVDEDDKIDPTTEAALEAAIAREQEQQDDGDDDLSAAAFMGGSDSPYAADEAETRTVLNEGPSVTKSGESATPNVQDLIEICVPPTIDTAAFDPADRWDAFQGERFDDVLEHDSITVWNDEAGSGKTTNAGLAAIERDIPHVVYFNQHKKAREFILDDVFPNDVDLFHLKGGEQKRKPHCMDSHHAGDDHDCPEHGHSTHCPSMCPVYDLSTDHEIRQLYDALVPEVGPNKAHQILELQDETLHPWHGGECWWQAQYGEVEQHDFVVAVHPYMVQQSVRDGRLNIIDESPALNARERSLSVEKLTRMSNTLSTVADRPGTPDGLEELARFADDVVNVITDADTTLSLDQLDAPEADWETFDEPGVTPEYGTKRELPGETLTKCKVEYGETILQRMKGDTWEGAPISLDPLLATAARAGLPEMAVAQALSVPAVLEQCPWCRSEVHFDNGARCCSDDDCDWHEAHNTITRRDTPMTRASAWLQRNDAGVPVGVTMRALPLPEQLPAPEDTLVLDATATPSKVATLWSLGESDIQVAGDEPVDIPNLRLTQVLDGQYHASTIKSSDTARERIQRAIDTAGRVHRKPLFVVKQSLIPLFDFPEDGEVLHYHATRGLNRNDCDAVMCIGAPHPRMDDVERNARLLAKFQDGVRVGGDEYGLRRDTTGEYAAEPPVYRKLLYEDGSGEGRAIPTKHYAGLVGDLFRETREKELVQAVHRIRPLLADETKHAYLLTNVPTDLPVDELASFDELVDPLDAMLPVPPGAIDLLGHVRDVVAGDGPDGFRAQALVEQRDDGTIANKTQAFHRLATVAGMDVSERTVYDWVAALEDVGLLHPESYEQHAGVTYTVDAATLQSALQVLSGNGGFKVAAVRRFRALVERSSDAFEWVEWAREVFELGDGPPGGGSPTHSTG